VLRVRRAINQEACENQNQQSRACKQKFCFRLAFVGDDDVVSFNVAVNNYEFGRILADSAYNLINLCSVNVTSSRFF
jgi:hypothetical protein